LQKTTPLVNEDFGSSVDIDGNQIVVGAMTDITRGDDFGAAYLFDASTGNLIRTFVNPGTVAGSDFGISAAISGNLVIVGAEREDVSGQDNAGAAYLFDASTGIKLRTFNEISPQADHRFGSSVDVNGTHVLIGASKATVNTVNSGVAYLFNIATGAQIAQYSHPAASGNDRFGESVSLSDNKVLVGAWQTSAGATNTGAAYLFDADGTFDRSFTLSSPTGFEQFGVAVSLDGINGAIGAPNEGSGGVAYVYDVTTGTIVQRIVDPTTATSTDFGKTISVDGNNVLVGDQGANEAYLYDITTGSLIHTFTAPNLGSFSSGVAIDGDNVIIGAQNDNTGAVTAGAAYLYQGVPSSGGSQTQGQVSIAGTCGISFDSGTPINYGNLVPDNTSAEQVMNIQNTGTITADLLVSGTNWVDSLQTSVITVDETKYAETSGTYASKTSLTTSPTVIGGISFDPTTSIPLYWELLADLINPTFVGSLTQEMTFSASC
jgi:hypothetical protein